MKFLLILCISVSLTIFKTSAHLGKGDHKEISVGGLRQGYYEGSRGKENVVVTVQEIPEIEVEKKIIVVSPQQNPYPRPLPLSYKALGFQRGLPFYPYDFNKIVSGGYDRYPRPSFPRVDIGGYGRYPRPSFPRIDIGGYGRYPRPYFPGVDISGYDHYPRPSFPGVDISGYGFARYGQPRSHFPHVLFNGVDYEYHRRRPNLAKTGEVIDVAITVPKSECSDIIKIEKPKSKKEYLNTQVVKSRESSQGKKSASLKGYSQKAHPKSKSGSGVHSDIKGIKGDRQKSQNTSSKSSSNSYTTGAKDHSSHHKGGTSDSYDSSGHKSGQRRESSNTDDHSNKESSNKKNLSEHSQRSTGYQKGSNQVGKESDRNASHYKKADSGRSSSKNNEADGTKESSANSEYQGQKENYGGNRGKIIKVDTEKKSESKKSTEENEEKSNVNYYNTEKHSKGDGKGYESQKYSNEKEGKSKNSEEYKKTSSGEKKIIKTRSLDTGKKSVGDIFDFERSRSEESELNFEKSESEKKAFSKSENSKIKFDEGLSLEKSEEDKLGKFENLSSNFEKKSAGHFENKLTEKGGYSHSEIEKGGFRDRKNDGRLGKLDNRKELNLSDIKKLEFEGHKKSDGHFEKISNVKGGFSSVEKGKGRFGFQKDRKTGYQRDDAKQELERYKKSEGQFEKSSDVKSGFSGVEYGRLGVHKSDRVGSVKKTHDANAELEGHKSATGHFKKSSDIKGEFRNSESVKGKQVGFGESSHSVGKGQHGGHSGKVSGGHAGRVDLSGHVEKSSDIKGGFRKSESVKGSVGKQVGFGGSSHPVGKGHHGGHSGKVLGGHVGRAGSSGHISGGGEFGRHVSDSHDTKFADGHAGGLGLGGHADIGGVKKIDLGGDHGGKIGFGGFNYDKSYSGGLGFQTGGGFGSIHEDKVSGTSGFSAAQSFGTAYGFRGSYGVY